MSENTPTRYDAYVCAALTGLLANPEKVHTAMKMPDKSVATQLVQEAMSYADALQLFVKAKEEGRA